MVFSFYVLIMVRLIKEVTTSFLRVVGTYNKEFYIPTQNLINNISVKFNFSLANIGIKSSNGYNMNF